MNGALRRFDASILLFGCGKMAGAMLHRWLADGMDPAQVVAVRKSGASVADGVTVVTNGRGLAAPDILCIGVKPQQFAALAPQISPLIGAKTLVLSMMAGIEITSLRAALQTSAPIARIMPNMPVADGLGVVAFTGEMPDATRAMFDALLAPLGMVCPLADEAALDAVAALTGCGPAFFYAFAEAMAGAAMQLGIAGDDADALTRATLFGATSTLRNTRKSAQELAREVASPGGMTQAGLDVLAQESTLSRLMAATLEAAALRGRALAALAKAD